MYERKSMADDPLAKMRFKAKEDAHYNGAKTDKIYMIRPPWPTFIFTSYYAMMAHYQRTNERSQ